jgi:hypothetical protein
VGVTVVCKHEAHSLGLTDNAVTNVELIFSFVRKSLESDLFFVACSNEPDLMLLVDIVQSSEGKLESILLSLLRSVADIESVVGFLGDGVRQAATFEGEAVVSNGIEADCGWHLSLILENDRHDAVLTNTGLAELKSGVSVLLIRLSRLLNLQSRKSAFTTKVENELAHLGLRVSVLNNSLKDSTILHHSIGQEAHSHVFMLVGFNSEALLFDFKSESLRLGLASRLYLKLNSARNLVGVHNLEPFLSALRVLGSYESTEPEALLLDREEAGVDNSLSVDRGVKRRNNSLLFEDLLNILGVDSRVR